MTSAAAAMGSVRAPVNTGATLSALVAGLGLGLGAEAVLGDELAGLADVAAAVGGAWAAALRLIVVPVVACVLVTGLGGTAGRTLGRLGATSFFVFLGMLLAGALVSVSSAPLMLRWLEVPRGALAGAIDGTNPAPPTGSPPSFDGWLRGLSDGSFGRALARGELLPLLILMLIVALALTRVDEAPRRRLLDFFSALQSLLFVILAWILAAAPVAVFALAFAMTARKGLSAAHVLGSFLLVLVLLLAAFCIALYPAAVVVGRVGLRRFAAAALPAQAVAAGTRSSLASLPALLQSGERLGLPAAVNAFVMPLSVSVFKANRLISGPTKMLFLTHVYGIEVAPIGIAAYIAMELLLSVGTPGTPNGGAYPSTAALLAMGVPMEGIALVHAVYALPDVLMTLTNVTADLTAGAIVARFTRGMTTAPATALEAAPA